MKIIPLPKDDNIIRTVATWFFHEWAALNPDASIDKIAAGLVLRAESRQIPLTIIALNDNGTPVGAANLTPTDMQTHKELTPWMSGVYVLPEYRGRGIGSALCKRIEEEARRLSFSKIYLATEDQQSLYSRLGWKTLFDEEYKGVQATVMMLSLE
jgi:predicted N-acetyltransferase YhbS